MVVWTMHVAEHGVEPRMFATFPFQILVTLMCATKDDASVREITAGLKWVPRAMIAVRREVKLSRIRFVSAAQAAMEALAQHSSEM
jgi:hypothetical protein